jgi:hypothetical protein
MTSIENKDTPMWQHSQEWRDSGIQQKMAQTKAAIFAKQNGWACVVGSGKCGRSTAVLIAYPRYCSSPFQRAQAYCEA